MDRLTSYRQIIKEVLDTQATYTSSDMPNIENQAVIDAAQNRFMLIVSGWHKKEYIHTVAFHIEIKSDKVWVYEDVTDVGIAQELMEQGIPEADIFLAYNNPFSQGYTDAKVA